MNSDDLACDELSFKLDWAEIHFHHTSPLIWLQLNQLNLIGPRIIKPFPFN